MDVGAHLLARNHMLGREPLMIRLRTEYAARRAAEEAAQRQVETAGRPLGSRRRLAVGWRRTGCDCAECRALARRGLLGALPRAGDLPRLVRQNRRTGRQRPAAAWLGGLG